MPGVRCRQSTALGLPWALMDMNRHRCPHPTCPYNNGMRYRGFEVQVRVRASSALLGCVLYRVLVTW